MFSMVNKRSSKHKGLLTYVVRPYQVVQEAMGPQERLVYRAFHFKDKTVE